MAEKDATFKISPQHYADAREMLAQEQPDVVSICTWHSGHATWTIAATVHRPKAILCEKPMADTIGRAEQMLLACQRNGVKLGIAHQRRWLPPTRTRSCTSESPERTAPAGRRSEPRTWSRRCRDRR